MQDLTGSIWSEMATDAFSALIPTSQEGGNCSYDSNALSAPGSEPANDLRSLPGEIIVHAAPVLDTENFTSSPVERGADGSHVNHDSNDDRPTVFTNSDGGGWMTSRESGVPLPDVSDRSLVRRGQWNQL